MAQLTITIGMAPSVQVLKYQFIKPSASVTYVIDADADEEVVAAARKRALARLRAELMHVACMELETSSEMAAAAEDGVEALTAYVLSQTDSNRTTKKAKKK